MVAAETHSLTNPRVCDPSGEDDCYVRGSDSNQKPVEVGEVFRPQSVGIASQFGRLQPVVDLVRLRTQQRSGARDIGIDRGSVGDLDHRVAPKHP